MTEDIIEQQTAQKESLNQPAWLTAAQKQWKLYAGIALVLTLIIGGFWWYHSQEDAKNIEALTQLSRIRSTFDAGNFEAALTADSIAPVGENKVLGLLEISQNYEGTHGGAVSALMAGNALTGLGRYDEARDQFNRALSDDAVVIQVGAMQGLAACLESSGKYAEAADMYEKAAQTGVETPFEPQNLFFAALCYEKTGNKEKAGSIFTTVAKKFETSAIATDAKVGLARLGMAID